MLYMVTFTINIPPMLAYIPYMDREWELESSKNGVPSRSSPGFSGLMRIGWEFYPGQGGSPPARFF